MNRAFEKGKKHFEWWPDWSGQCAVIVASGESTQRAGVESTRDRVNVLAIKKNVEILPWAEVCYGCDAAWWNLNKGLPDFKGVKIAHASTLFANYKDMKRVHIEDRDEILVDEPLRIGSGGNSGFQAINLAVQFGATSIALVGYDMKGEHWYGRNPLPMNNPAPSNFKRWLRGFRNAAPGLSKMGIEVVNCSDSSDIDCFQKISLRDTMTEWGL